MKIGIITYHRSHNYGALLQAIGLREFLRDIGYEVYYIDYWPKYHKHIYSLFSFSVLFKQSGLKGKYRYIRKCLNNFFVRKVRYKNFSLFIKKQIYPHLSSLKEEYDVVILGSDQIWRKQPEINTYNPVYFGKNDIKAKFKMTYAASMGLINVEPKDRELLKEYLSHLDVISVREKDLKQFIEGLGFDSVRLDPDPALLLSGDKWAKLMCLKDNSFLEDKTERYVLYYKIFDSFDEGCLRTFAKQMGCKLKIVYSKAIKNEIYSTVGPDVFLDLIYNASYVFTSSYHGLVFSLLFHKPFFASFTNNSGRAESLLTEIGLKERLLIPYAPIPKSCKEINFDVIDGFLTELRIQTKKYFIKVYNKIN